VLTILLKDFKLLTLCSNNFFQLLYHIYMSANSVVIADGEVLSPASPAFQEALLSPNPSHMSRRVATPVVENINNSVNLWEPRESQYAYVLMLRLPSNYNQRDLQQWSALPFVVVVAIGATK